MLEHFITTPDGSISIFWDEKDERRTIVYRDLDGHENHLGTLKDGKYLWMDGT